MSGTLALRTWCAETVEVGIGPDPRLDAVLARLAWLDGEVHQAWTALDVDRRTWPYRLLHLRESWGRPLPPLSRRPWPPEAPITAKLTGTLRHYGPLALAREIGAWWRWRRMSPERRDRALRGEG